jgi:hypothetical protein
MDAGVNFLFVCVIYSGFLPADGFRASWQRSWKAAEDKFDLSGNGVFIDEGDGAVRMNLNRAKGGDGLSGKEERCGDDG